METQTLLAVLHFVPSTSGLKMASVRWSSDPPDAELAHLLQSSWTQALEAYASEQTGSLTQARCCKHCSGTTFEALTVCVLREPMGSIAWEVLPHTPWLCLECGGLYKNHDTKTVSAHTVLVMLDATQRRAASYFGPTFVGPQPGASGPDNVP